MNHYDIIIIGTGAGGSTIAHKLAPSGNKILILEHGDYIPKEKENWDQVEVFSKGRYRANVEQMYDKDDKPFSPFTHYCVGGNTKFYGVALLRLRESDFKEVKHYDGVSPACPISYSDLEKYYSEAERMYSVHGERGHDLTEPKASASYPFPPLKMEEDMKELFENFQSLGYHPFPCPVAVRLNENKNGVAPTHLSNFDGFPDLTEAKADAHVVALQDALKYPNVKLLTNCFAEKLITDANGKRVTSAMVIHNGEKEIYSADTIIVSCGAINSAALMLRSANEKHPNGLANSSDQVGRNYMQHNNGALIVVSKKQNRAQFQKAFGVADFYHGADVNDIVESRAKMICADGERIAVFKYDGKLSAVNNLCRHQNGPLGEGKIVDGCITCPWHGYQYLPHNGQSPPPFKEKVETYNVKLIGTKVYVNPKGYPEGTFVEPLLIKK